MSSLLRHTQVVESHLPNKSSAHMLKSFGCCLSEVIPCKNRVYCRRQGVSFSILSQSVNPFVSFDTIYIHRSVGIVPFLSPAYSQKSFMCMVTVSLDKGVKR